MVKPRVSFKRRPRRMYKRKTVNTMGRTGQSNRKAMVPVATQGSIRRVLQPYTNKVCPIAGGATMATGGIVYYTADLLESIPVYDPTLAAPRSVLRIARTSTKIFVKGIRVRFNWLNQNTKTTAFRILMFRNTNPKELYANNGVNQYESNTLVDETYSNDLIAGPLQRFNRDLCNSRSELYMDKLIRPGMFNTLPNWTATSGGSPSGGMTTYVTLNKIVHFETLSAGATPEPKGGEIHLVIVPLWDGGTSNGNLYVSANWDIFYAET